MSMLNAPPERADLHIEAAPVPSVLNIMLLIAQIEHYPALDAALLAAAARIDDDLRDSLRDLAGHAEMLPLDGDMSDFPTYLATILVADDRMTLAAVWQQVLVPAWPQLLKTIVQQAAMLERFSIDHRNTQPVPFATALRTRVARDIDPTGLPLVFVPAPWNGRYVTALRSSTAVYVFFQPMRWLGTLCRSAPTNPREITDRFAALADETRLRILALFADRDEITATDVREALDMTQPTASRHLAALGSVLAERRSDDKIKRYRLNPDALSMPALAVEQIIAQGWARAEAGFDQRDTQPADLRRFMAADGRLAVYPSKLKDKLSVLPFVAAQFAAGQTYTEHNVNDLIKQRITFEDYVTLRRDLCDFRYLTRSADGAVYQVGDPATSPALAFYREQ